MSDLLTLLVQAENILFLSSLLVFAALLTLQMLGFAGDSLGADIGLDIDADVDMDVDAADLTSVSQVPTITLLMLFCASFGVLGLISNRLIPEFIDVGTAVQATISIVLSGVVSWIVSRKTARFIGSVVPMVESHGINSADLNSCLGKVVSEKMTQTKAGRITITDSKKGVYQLRGLLIDGHEQVNQGELVVVVRHDTASGVCFCIPEAAWVSSRK